MKVAVITVNVTDMDKALEFYAGIVGFEIESKQLYPDIVELKNGDVPFILQKATKTTASNYPEDTGVYLAIATDDARATLLRFKQLGVELVHDGIQDFPAGKMFAFKDPFGTVWECLQFM